MTDKDLLRAAYVEGWLRGHGVEQPNRQTREAAKSAFERWYDKEVAE